MLKHNINERREDMIIEAKGFPCYLDGWLCVLDGSKIPTRNEYLKIIGQYLSKNSSCMVCSDIGDAGQPFVYRYVLYSVRRISY